MGARIFISYRTSDGRDKATALARELGTRFGDDVVFLDKEDLRGGAAWRDEIEQTLGAAPVLLLLWTPGLLGELDAAGRPRAADPNDPVRRELEAALAASVHVIPLLCDGVETAPAGGALPAPFDRLVDYTWRRLRAYDWRSDVERLVADLQALDLQPLAAADAARRHRRIRVAFAAVGVVALGLAGTFGWRHWNAAPTALVPAGLAGTWIATVDPEPPFPVTLARREDQVVLTSEPIPLEGRASWADYRAFWLRLTGTELRAIRYRGSGTLQADPGQALVVDIAWKVYNGEGDTQIDSGNLHAAAAADGQSLAGQLWSNGAQSERPVLLRRPR
jgi:hypothetical protein